MDRLAAVAAPPRRTAARSGWSRASGGGSRRAACRSASRRCVTRWSLVDVLFAVDSVPAILAITTDTFVVFAANAFALLGLRPLFFLVADLVERLYYLKAALAVLLVFIGGKMAFGELAGKLPPTASLAGVALILGTGIVASLLRKARTQTPAPAA